MKLHVLTFMISGSLSRGMYLFRTGIIIIWVMSNGSQIPKPDQEQGLGISWPAKKADMEKLKEYFNDVKAKI